MFCCCYFDICHLFKYFANDSESYPQYDKLGGKAAKPAQEELKEHCEGHVRFTCQPTLPRNSSDRL